MTLYEWAIKHHVSFEAMQDLQNVFGIDPYIAAAVDTEERSESAVVAEVRLEAADTGHTRLWRNNVGAGKLESGSFVRFGLANDSKAINEVVKSADLIGIRSVLITPAHIGQTMGLFVSRECKEPGWKFAGTQRENAQMAWAQMINFMGGDARFCTGRGTL